MIPLKTRLQHYYIEDKMNIGSGPHNHYMPLYTTTRIEKIGDTYFYYGFIKDHGYYNINSYNQLYDTLKGNDNNIRRFSKANVSLLPGYMWNPLSGDPLLMLAINHINWYDADYRAKTKHFRLYLSTSLVTSEQYKNLWKNIQKNYLPYFHENRIPVIITTSKGILRETMNDGITLKFRHHSEETNAIEAIRSSYGQTSQ